jgi:hypothetical protein
MFKLTMLIRWLQSRPCPFLCSGASHVILALCLDPWLSLSARTIQPYHSQQASACPAESVSFQLTYEAPYRTCPRVRHISAQLLREKMPSPNSLYTSVGDQLPENFLACLGCAKSKSKCEKKVPQTHIAKTLGCKLNISVPLCSMFEERNHM